MRHAGLILLSTLWLTPALAQDTPGDNFNGIINQLLRQNEETFEKRSRSIEQRSVILGPGDQETKNEYVREWAQDVPVRLWVQVYPSTSDAVVDRLRQGIDTLDAEFADASREFEFKSVTVVEAGPNSAELRYFKPTDAELAQDVAARLSEAYGKPVSPVDMTDRYAASAYLEPGHLEFWAGFADLAN